MSEPSDRRVGIASQAGTAPREPVELPPELDPRGPRHAAPRAGSARVLPARPRRWRAARVLSWIAVVLSFAVFASASAGYLLYRHYDNKIDRIPVFNTLPSAARPASAPRGAQNVLLVGSDSRDGAVNSAFQGTGAETVTGQRSDTVILAHLYGNSDQAQLVSFPRDSYVAIPAHRDAKTGAQQPASKGKLNSAIGLGGPALLIATIEQLTSVKVDHYVQIDFNGFQAMVDKLGGVEVCLTQPAKEKNSGIDLPAGRQTIDGKQALAFVRQRYELPGSDLGRIKRQQQFIGSVVRKVLSAGTLLNPVKLNGFLDVATSSLQVDQELSPGDLRDLALRLRSFNSGGVLFSTVPIAGDRKIDRQDVLVLDEPKAAELFTAIRRDSPPGLPVTAPTPSAKSLAAPLTVQPGAIRVAVRNGAGTAGLGRRAAADLERVGFVVVGVPQNSGAGATGTVVLYGPDKAESARTLAAALPGSTSRLEPSLDRTLQVVVGTGYAPAVPVTVAGAPTPTPTASASPPLTPPAITAAEDICAR